jgi:hypothetical protein
MVNDKGLFVVNCAVVGLHAAYCVLLTVQLLDYMLRTVCC